MRKTPSELQAIRDSVSWVGRLSDNIVHFGPFSLGIDGVLSWIPGVGEVYSTVAGAFIVLQGVRAGVPAPILATAAALLACRTLISGVPIAGAAFADVFTAHRWAAGLIVRAIDQQLGAAPAAAEPGSWGSFLQPLGRSARRAG